MLSFQAISPVFFFFPFFLFAIKPQGQLPFAVVSPNASKNLNGQVKRVRETKCGAVES
jgi:hypothetical protein